MTAHNLYELPISPFAPENTGPLIVGVVLVATHLAWPRSRVPLLALFGWAALNLVGGGVVSVLPLPFLPFEPEQTVSHYGAHVVYSLGQVPLLLVTWLAVVRSGGRPRRGANATVHGSDSVADAATA